MIKRLWPAILILIVAVACQPAPPPTTMNLISYGQTVNGNLHGQQDRWLFIAGPHDTITVDLSADGEAPTATLLDSNSTVISQLAVKQNQQFDLPTNGSYSIAITGTGSYTLTLKLISSLPVAQAQITATLSISPNLSGSASPSPSFGPVIAASPLITDTSTDTPTATDTLPPTFTPVNTPTITPTPTLIPVTVGLVGAQLQIGQTIQSVLGTAQQVDRYALFAPANTIVSIGMFPAYGTVPIPAFDMYAPDGTQISSITGTKNSAQAVVSGLILPVTGAYIIYPHSVGGVGPYTLTIGESWTLREVGGGTLLPNTLAIGNLPRTGDRETWQIQLPASSAVTIDAQPYQSQVDPVIEVVSLDGTRLATGHDFSAANHANVKFTTTQPGLYKIRITSYANNTTGSYAIKASLP